MTRTKRELIGDAWPAVASVAFLAFLVVLAWIDAGTPRNKSLPAGVYMLWAIEDAAERGAEKALKEREGK